MAFHLRIDGTVFRDGHNREVVLHGINMAADAKLPAHPDVSSHEPQNFFDGDNVSFVGRPFELSEAAKHFTRLRKWGYNTIRYIFTWEAIEAAGPGKYDEDWIQHTISVLRIAKSYGFYVFMDPHQDVWSRFTGGSGAPLWTIYACGLDPRAFAVTEAALVHNTWPDPAKFPKMIWATNYYRLACATIFTLFWAGRDYAPLAIIDGKNIQDYLQAHLIGAVQHLATRIKEAKDLDKTVVIGWETMNEPNRGMVGLQDVTTIPADQKLKKGTSSTIWQAILLGSGRACEVETWDVGSMGPYKSGKQLIDPQGQMAWLQEDYDDTRYGWKRDPNWRLGECVWAQHNVWEPATNEVLRKGYFSKNPRNGDDVDYEYFTNHWFMDFVRKYKSAIRSIFPETIIFVQPPVLEVPPILKSPADADPDMVFAPHWYDGLTLMNKTWNRLWNVDVVGILRGRYSSPAFAIKVGETAIRNCFRDQLNTIRKEGMDNMGARPCLFSELGIPYDMDDGKAYKTGDYTSQIAAMDANHFALESNKLNYTLWTYCASNVHQWGDQWNGEDLSIYSRDDPTPPTTLANNEPPTSPTSSESNLLTTEDSHAPLIASNMEASPSWSNDMEGHHFRAAAAFIRPYPVATHGNLVSYSFILKSADFKVTVNASTPTPQDVPTEIFLPELHFPRGQAQVNVSGSKWEIYRRQFGEAEVQMLRWWHAPGQQTLTVKGVVRPKATGMSEADDGYFDRCLEKGCGMM